MTAVEGPKNQRLILSGEGRFWSGGPLMTKHVLEVEETVLREGREISFDTAARDSAKRLFAQVADYLGEGAQYPREATVEYSWRQKEMNAEQEVWVARAEISLHPVTTETENPHSVAMDNRLEEQAGS